MAARKHNPGPTPQRGEVAMNVISVRLTSDELARLDSLWHDPGRRVVRGDVVRHLIASAVGAMPPPVCWRCLGVGCPKCGRFDAATGKYL